VVLQRLSWRRTFGGKPPRNRERTMKIAYFDCFSGAAGDMLVASLLDAGASLDAIQSCLSGLEMHGFRVRADKIRKQGLAATQFIVETDEGEAQPHRHLSHVREILVQGLPEGAVRNRALATFERLAAAEGAVHGMPAEQVHFHEVGAIDAIVDIVGVMAALDELGIERIASSPLPTGTGTVRCAHGLMPVPAPATAELLRGLPIRPSDEPGELLTPTGAAVLTTIANSFGQMPAMRLERVGLGAGQRDTTGLPNVVRVMIGETADSADQDAVAILEANIDDAPGEWIGHCLGRLLDAGALDAYCVPIHMKKSRPGVVLTVICEPARSEELESILFAETTTFGVRRTTAGRSRLTRRHETLNTPYGVVRMKIGERHGRVVSFAPEYDDCVSAARSAGVPLREVMQAAVLAWRSKVGS
jgi:uncharacterized protein (TIGR00299 family) protein